MSNSVKGSIKMGRREYKKISASELEPSKALPFLNFAQGISYLSSLGQDKNI